MSIIISIRDLLRHYVPPFLAFSSKSSPVSVNLLFDFSNYSGLSIWSGRDFEHANSFLSVGLGVK